MMKYNLYELSDEFDVNSIPNTELNSAIVARLKIIENEIAVEFLKKQKGKIGIKTLGNEIRYNSILKDEFKNPKSNQLIIKLTENRRAFIKVFLDKWTENNSKEIYFLILENSFGNSSNMVDKSFIRIEEIIEELSRFNNNFKKTSKGPNVKFVEFKGFDNFYLINNDGYTLLKAKNI